MLNINLLIYHKVDQIRFVQILKDKNNHMKNYENNNDNYGPNSLRTKKKQ